MKYEKAKAEVVDFGEFVVFMDVSGMANGTSCNGWSNAHHSCATYTVGQSCGGYTTTSFGGGTCNSYNGSKCFDYTDDKHPASNPCTEYGMTCGAF